MALRHRIEYLRREHTELLRLANRIEAALAAASKESSPNHLRGITELRVLEHGFSGIAEHCHSEERILESTLHHYLDADERLRIDEEHGKIVRALAEFREELRFATADRTMSMVIPGMNVVNQLRAHISDEEKLLDRIMKSAGASSKRAMKKKPPKRTLAPRKTRAHKPSVRSGNANRCVPYTLEPHPEL
jgi:hemerythrin